MLDRQAGFEDGRAGRWRMRGGYHYLEGYDDGLDQYDRDHCVEEGWTCA